MRTRNVGRRCSNDPCPNMAEVKGQCRTCDRYTRRTGTRRKVTPGKNAWELARARHERQIEREMARRILRREKLRAESG